MGEAPAAERAVTLLRHLARQARPVTAASIARDLAMPRSSAYRLLTTLEAARFVTHFPEEQRWGLGVGAFELGSAYLRQEPLERLARPLVHRLAHDSGAAAHLGVLDGRDVLYLVKDQPEWTPPLVTEVGVRLPAHLTASGRSLLATMSAAQVHALFPPGRPLPTRTGTGPTSPAMLRRVLTATRRRGHGEEDGEVVEGVASVAVAAHDHEGRGVAAMTLVFPREAHDAATRQLLADAAADAAGELTRRLRGRAG